jgi:hypothetical protein
MEWSGPPGVAWHVSTVKAVELSLHCTQLSDQFHETQIKPLLGI